MIIKFIYSSHFSIGNDDAKVETSEVLTNL